MKKTNEPVVLSGRVFASGLLACDRPDLSLPDTLRAGDVKLTAVRSENAGKARRASLAHYTGFFAGYVHDGKRWRRFNLRAGAAVVTTYVSDGDRKDKLHRAVTHLRTLRDRTAVWGQKGYEVRALPVSSKKSGTTGGKQKVERARKDRSKDGATQSGGEQLTLFR